MSRPHGFRSKLARYFIGYLAVRRALGYKLLSDERILRYLDRFLRSRFPEATDLSVPILSAWMAGLAPLTRASRLGMIRQVCLYRRRMTPGAFLPIRQRHPSLWPTRVCRHVPFIFTKEQIRALLRAALAMRQSSRTRGRSQAMFVALLLLYSAGLRLAEAARLRVADVDLAAGTLLIRNTKFFKSRIVPVAPDVLRQVKEHVTVLPGATTEQSLFQHRGRPYSSHTIGLLGAGLIRACGLKPARGRGGARVHDLRHSFAVHRITQWYADGEDVQSRLPMLATYMGHKDISSTQRYMSVTAEILGYAGQRFERACAPGEGR